MGDTDVFPRPFESLVLNDKSAEVEELIKTLLNNVKEGLANNGPHHSEMLAPTTSLGFRKVAALDPLWNAALLSEVLEIAPKIEAARPPLADGTVFSYRFVDDPKDHKLFSDASGWRAFLDRARVLAERFPFALSTDISDFYSRLNHHRLEAALRQCAPGHHAPKVIMDILSDYSASNSYGLPVGGNAARILAEASLIQIDHLLARERITYCRFVDDLIIFCNSLDEAYAFLAQVSQLLSDNQGLLLQRSKTRILKAAELQSSIKLTLDEEVDGDTPDLGVHRKRLSALNLRYDPYSARPEEDYENLKHEINNIDLFMLLEHELSKSTVHIHAARRIVSAMRFSSEWITVQTAETLIGDLNRLYPIAYLVLDVVRSLLIDVGSEGKDAIKATLIETYNNHAYALSIDYHLLFFVRALSCCPGNDTLVVLNEIHQKSKSPLVRREVILAMHRLGDWSWLSNQKSRFNTLSSPERRAFLVASFGLAEEGNHWRKRIRDSLGPFEQMILDWASDSNNLARV